MIKTLTSSVNWNHTDSFSIHQSQGQKAWPEKLPEMIHDAVWEDEVEDENFEAEENDIDFSSQENVLLMEQEPQSFTPDEFSIEAGELLDLSCWINKNVDMILSEKIIEGKLVQIGDKLMVEVAKVASRKR